MSPAHMLPPEFSGLEPFADQWAVMGMDARARARDDSTMDEKKAFHAAMSEAAQAVLDRVSTKRLADLDAPEQRLMTMLLSYGHVSLTLDGRENQESEHAACRQEMVLTRVTRALPMERALARSTP